MDPRSIDTFGGSFPAVLSVESCGFGVKKCGCSRGPNKLVHFSGKVLDLNLKRVTNMWLRDPSEPDRGNRRGCLGALGSAGVKQNSSEAKHLSCEHLVGVRRFELLTSSVSGKRSPPELNARSRVRECAGNNITELPPGGKNYFKKLVNCGPIGACRSANSTRKVPFVPPMNCTFA